MQDSAFPFLDLPAVTPKPRNRRWTILSDRGLTPEEQKNYLAMVHDIVDRMKNVDHVGLLQRHRADLIKHKNGICREFGIGVFPGGVPFEIAYMQGKATAFFQRLVELGFSGVEVSADCIPPIPAQDRERLIREASGLGLEVFTEVGHKRVGDILGTDVLDARTAVREIAADLAAGAKKVTVESNEISHYMTRGEPDRLLAIAGEVGLENVVFEIGAGGRVDTGLATWLLDNLGPDVNVENIEPDRLLHFEAMRRGLSRAGNFKFFAQYLA